MRSHQLALWAGVSAFFTTMLAIGAINILNPDDRVRFLGGFVVGLITGGAVYAKQRLDEIKGNGHRGTIVIKEIGDKKVFSLELDEAPEDLEQMKEVIFRVKHDERKE